METLSLGSSAIRFPRTLPRNTLVMVSVVLTTVLLPAQQVVTVKVDVSRQMGPFQPVWRGLDTMSRTPRTPDFAVRHAEGLTEHAEVLQKPLSLESGVGKAHLLLDNPVAGSQQIPTPATLILGNAAGIAPPRPPTAGACLPPGFRRAGAQPEMRVTLSRISARLDARESLERP